MKWRSTWFLLGLAGALLAFIRLVERPLFPPTSSTSEAPPRILSLRAADVTTVQVKRTNQVLIRVERTNTGWNITIPLANFPAQSFAIDGLLRLLENLSSRIYIPLTELSSGKRTVADFGLDLPQATVSLQYGNERAELQVGSRSPTGDQVYVQVLGGEGIYSVPVDLLEHLPSQFNEWRDSSLLQTQGIAWTRMEVKASGRGFAVEQDPTNKVFFLSKPTPARADAARLDVLWRRIFGARVARFENDSLRADLDAYGLQPPEAELTFSSGTNELMAVQFGRSPTNDPSVVYARCLQHTNIVLVARSVLDTLLIPATEWRDRRVLPFNPSAIDSVEFVGSEPFSVQRSTNAAWTITGTPPALADLGLLREWLDRLSRLEGQIENEVVTDFGSYGLAMPSRQYILRTTYTNAVGGLTNAIVAQLDIGGRQGERTFVRSRKSDENTVYSVASGEVQTLPSAPWQLRDRRVWTFTTNQVVRVSIRQHGYTRQFIRNPTHEWTLAPGTAGSINTLATEEQLFRLGHLVAAVWVAKGDENRVLYGFSDTGHKITIDLKMGDKPATVSVEFGERAASGYPLALATVDGQSWVFEFPLQLYLQLLPYLSNPPPKQRAP